MTTALSGTKPVWPRLAGITLLVMAAHGLLLVATPLRLAALKNDPVEAAKVFLTRSIAPQPAPEVVAPAKPPKPKSKPKPSPKPVSKPKIVPNEAVAPVERAPLAMDSIANEAPDPQPGMTLATSSEERLSPETSLPANATPLATVTASQPELQTPTATSNAAASQSLPAAASAAASAPAAVSVAPAAQLTVVSAVKLPGSASLVYKMTGTSKGLNYHATAELTWRNLGSDYEAGMRVSAFLLGSRSMSSVGRLTPGGLAPTRFSDKSRSEVAAHFEADKGKVSFSANTPDAPLLGGAQDRVSVFFQLGGILAASAGKEPPLGPGSSITIYTVGPRDADTWTFVVEADEALSLPAGDMATVKLTRKPRREFDQKIEIWYAPALGYLPVRNRITQANGDFVDQQLKSLDPP